MLNLQDKVCLDCGHDLDSHYEYGNCDVCQERDIHIESCPSSRQLGVESVTTPNMPIGGGRPNIPNKISSLRAALHTEQEEKDTITTARDLLLSSLLSIYAVPVSAFPKDEQKTVIVTLKEITERIRGLRKRLS